jgi:PAS domain S-box-containing protein
MCTIARTRAAWALLVALTITIFVIDAWTPLYIAVAVLYVVVVLLSARLGQRRAVILTSATCLSLTVLAYAISHSTIFFGPAMARLAISLAAVASTAFLALQAQAASNELKQREEALRRSEAFLSGTQHISHTGSFSFSEAGGELCWSDEVARILGYDKSVAPTIELARQRILPDDLGAVRACVEQAACGAVPVDLRTRLLMPDGAVKHVHVLVHRTYNQTGGCEYLGALMDVTATTEAEEALNRSQAQLAHVTRVTMLGELAASIAHEVSQPLAAMRTNGEASLRWLDRPQPDLVEARTAVVSMLDASARAIDVIRRIRALARKSDPQHTVLNLNAVVEEAVLLLRRELGSRQVTLTLALAPALPALKGDRIQLQQVIINLLMNGLQAMSDCAPGEASLVLSTCFDEPGYVCLTVRDTGTGIPGEHFARLFDPFFTTRAEGMGMGLAICRSIIENHGGRIWAQSQPGAGATLAFVLPTLEHRA